MEKGMHCVSSHVIGIYCFTLMLLYLGKHQIDVVHPGKCKDDRRRPS